MHNKVVQICHKQSISMIFDTQTKMISRISKVNTAPTCGNSLKAINPYQHFCLLIKYKYEALWYQESVPRGTNLPTPHFSWFPHPHHPPPGGAKIWSFRSYRKQLQNKYPIRNFTLDNFPLCGRCNILNSSRDIWVSNWRLSPLHHDITQIL